MAPAFSSIGIRYGTTMVGVKRSSVVPKRIGRCHFQIHLALSKYRPCDAQIERCRPCSPLVILFGRDVFSTHGFPLCSVSPHVVVVCAQILPAKRNIRVVSVSFFINQCFLW